MAYSDQVVEHFENMSDPTAPAVDPSDMEFDPDSTIALTVVVGVASVPAVLSR